MTMLKKFGKDSMEMTKTGIVMGVGAGVLKESGGDPSTMTKMSKFLPHMGNLSGTQAVLGGVKKLKKI